MAFLHVRFVQSEVTCQNIQLISSKLLASKAVRARNLSYQKFPKLLLSAMIQGSNRIKHVEKSIDEYIIEQRNENTRAKTTRSVRLLVEFLGEKNTVEQSSPEDIEAKELNEYSCFEKDCPKEA